MVLPSPSFEQKKKIVTLFTVGSKLKNTIELTMRMFYLKDQWRWLLSPFLCHHHGAGKCFLCWKMHLWRRKCAPTYKCLGAKLVKNLKQQFWSTYWTFSVFFLKATYVFGDVSNVWVTRDIYGKGLRALLTRTNIVE